MYPVARSNDFVLAVSAQLERLFGKEMMPLILNRLQIELDVDDVWEVAVQRPDAFEQAMRKIFGDAGPVILQVVYRGAISELERERKL